MAKYYLGVNNYFAVKRWPLPEEWLRIVREDFDLRIAQFALDLLDPLSDDSVRASQVRRLSDAAQHYGVMIHSLLTAGISTHMSLLLGPDLETRISGLNWFKNAITMAGQLSSKTVGGIWGALSMMDFDNTERRTYLLGFLKESMHLLGRWAKQNGLEYLVLEPSPVRRELPASIDETSRLYDYLNDGAPLPIRLLLDVGHACNFETSGNDLDPYFWIRKFGDRTSIIHLQQTDGKGDRHWPFTKAYNKLGIIDADKVLDAMNKAGMKDTYLLLELVHAFEADENQVLDDFRESVEYWKKALG